MTNHPKRGPKGPSSNPAQADILAARKASGLTQTDAASLVHASLRAWQQWEAGDRRMHPGLWALFQVRAMSDDAMRSAFGSWLGEQPRANDTVDESAVAAWIAACEWLQTASLPETAGGEIRPIMGHHETKGD